MGNASRRFRLPGAAALVVGLLAVLIAPAAAQQDSPDGPTMDWDFDNVPRSFVDGPNAIYYPWVANDDDFGLGAADTSISVQNLEDRDGQIWIYVGNGNNGWTLATTAALSAYASKTFTAAQLGIASGEGAPVAVMGFSWVAVAGGNLPWTGDEAPATGSWVETVVLLSNPLGPGAGQEQVLACVANNAAGNPSPFRWMADPAILDDYGIDYFTAGNGDVWVTGAWDQDVLQDLLDAANVDNEGPLVNPFGGLNGDGDCRDALSVSGGGVSLSDALAIGGVAKMAVAGNNLPMTTSNDTAVSGYNAINGLEVARFNEWYLPIVQTNCGPGGCWNSIIRVANLADMNSAVTVRFFPADDGSGSLQTGFQIQLFLNGGETGHINLGDYVPEGWVGSAHIYSDGWVFAMVDRYKVGYDMWLTNTGSASEFEQATQWQSWITDGLQYALFAPSVMSDWFGWNTGINVANLVNTDNNVSIQYFNLFGNATQGQSKRLAPHGMTYFYDPSDLGQNISTQNPANDPNAGVVGSAIIWSDFPVAAAIDATKYPETSPGTSTDWFQATTYNATQNIYTFQAVPLVQKGNPASGMGATSGINMLNPNPVAAQANVYWVNPSGFNASNFGISTITIPAYSNGFVYTMFHHNLPNGFVGAAQVISNVPIAAVSANVDYQVDGDGSAIFNAFNHCGFYRTTDVGRMIGQVDDAPWDCFFGDPLETSGQSVTKTFVDEWGNPVAGVNFHIVNDNPDFDPAQYATSDVNGYAFFGNVPVGNYELIIDSVPAGYLIGEQPADEFTLLQGEDWAETNELLFAQGVQKMVIVDGTAGEASITLGGVNVAIFENTGTVADPIFGDQITQADGITNASGVYTQALPVGSYLLCIWDANGQATLPSGETVAVAGLNTALNMLETMLVNGDCEAFDLEAGGPETFNTEEITNEVSILGDLNGFVFQIVNPEVPEPDVEVCLILADVYADNPQPEDFTCVDSDEDGLFSFSGIGAGDYVLTIYKDGLVVTFMGVEGGALTIDFTTVDEDGASATPATISFFYDPADDLNQDGWVDDELNDVASPDIRIELEESLLHRIDKDVQLNGEPAPVTTLQIIGVTGRIHALMNDRTSVGIEEGGTTGIAWNPPESVQNGNYLMLVTSGEYELCSRVLVQIDAGSPYFYWLCEDVILDDPLYQALTFTNNHETIEITKQVLLDGEPYANEAEAVGVTITDENGEHVFGPLATDDEGNVVLTLPVPAEGSSITSIEICSYVSGTNDICETVDFDDLPDANTFVNNHAPLGQLDIRIFSTPGPEKDVEACLYDDEDTLIGCATNQAYAYLINTTLGIFFAGLPTGDYSLKINIEGFSSGLSQSYSVSLDSNDTYLDDIENTPGNAIGSSTLRMLGKWDWVVHLNVGGLNEQIAPEVTISPGDGQVTP